ncbi:hypothetical protein [Nitrospina watsonii]|uniref:Calx-beta domain-containing protein n=1 Tax=Nitrospina watsonii TaxID=1323948 RepID=A0ABM9HHD6_9BACT|nr:hypothetical protein [Nitrospina watsonii]CAI2719736.1 exported protein of unknown function [Nitrospina watsonii]
MKRFIVLAGMVTALLGTVSWAGAITYKGDLKADESVLFPEQVTPPANPPSGNRKLYFRDDGNLYQLDAAGIENPVIARGGKNALINGNFRIWQRGTSFTATGYSADRWWHEKGGGGAVTISRQSFALGQVDVPGEPEFFLRHDQTTGGSSPVPKIVQRIEDVRTFAGETITLSFWVKGTAPATDLTVFLVQVFGSGGAPSSDVAVNVGTYSFTGSWSKKTFTVAVPSISGKTIGTNDDDYLDIRVAQSAVNETFTLDIANVQVEKGSVATEFERRPLGLELSLCERYFAKTFPIATAPAQNAGVTGSLYWNGNSGVASIMWRFPVRMRASPTITLYNPSAANNNGRNIDDSTDKPLSQQHINDQVAVYAVSSASAANDNDRLSIHMTADAEL